MDLQRKITLLDQAIAIERKSIRTNFRISIAVFVAAIIGAVLVNLMTPGGTLKLALTICTGCGSFLSGIPIRDTAGKRLKIEALSYLKSEYERFVADPNLHDEQSLAEIEKRFWTFFDKNL